jgi:two-component system response regulator RstA
MQDSDSTNKNKLLLLADHCGINQVQAVLEEEGYFVHYQACQQFDTDLLEVLDPDAILIDLENPSLESISICQTLQKYHKGPILVLSAKVNDLVQVKALEFGADDFLLKPLPEKYLLVKLRTFFRLFEINKQQKRMVQLGDLVVDSARREVRCSGETISLTSREFDLLWCLAKKAKSIVSRDEIHKSLFSSEYNGYDRAIDIYISRIRQKIGDDPNNPRYLKTIRGAGYLLVDNQV